MYVVPVRYNVVKHFLKILPGLRERSVTPPKFILEQQTEYHMKAEVFS